MARTFKVVVAEPGVDTAGDDLTDRALDSIATRINTRPMFVTLEHQPNVPPVGRLRNAQVVPGVPSRRVTASATLFDPDDYRELAILGVRRVTLPPDSGASSTPDALISWGYTPTSRPIVEELSTSTLQGPIRPVVQKSMDAPEILSLSFLAGTFAGAFLKSLANAFGTQASDAVYTGATTIGTRVLSWMRGGNSRYLTIRAEHDHHDVTAVVPGAQTPSQLSEALERAITVLGGAHRMVSHRDDLRSAVFTWSEDPAGWFPDYFAFDDDTVYTNSDCFVAESVAGLSIEGLGREVHQPFFRPAPK